MSEEQVPIQSCSFCGNPREDVKILIAGPKRKGLMPLICDDCIAICVEIMGEEGIKVPLLDFIPNRINLKELGLKPRFGKISFIQRENHCFHLCPFAEPFNTIYKDHVTRALTSQGFTISRADEIYGTEPIMDDIWEAINTATLITADVTGRNPNVMYEIGMAHTVGKPVIILTQSMDDVPFDLKHYRCLVYEYTPRGCSSLEERLTATVKALKGKI